MILAWPQREWTVIRSEGRRASSKRPAPKTRVKRAKALPTGEGARARLLHVTKRAVVVLGDREGGLAWLNASNVTLGGRRPVEVLGDAAGETEVLRALGRIEGGVYWKPGRRYPSDVGPVE